MKQIDSKEEIARLLDENSLLKKDNASLKKKLRNAKATISSERNKKAAINKELKKKDARNVTLTSEQNELLSNLFPDIDILNE